MGNLNKYYSVEESHMIFKIGSKLGFLKSPQAHLITLDHKFIIWALINMVKEPWSVIPNWLKGGECKKNYKRVVKHRVSYFRWEKKKEGSDGCRDVFHWYD